MLAGLEIGAIIHDRGYNTSVLDDHVCDSVCGLAWLGGRTRFAQSRARIGFHAAFNPDGSINPAANAVVGAYLDKLGMSMQAIAWMTSSQPDQIASLNFTLAQELGIAVTWVPSQQAEVQPQQPTPPVAQPNIQDWHKFGNWIQVASRDNLPDAQSVAADLHKKARDVGNVYIFKSTSTSGWYVIALGPFPPRLAGEIMKKLSDYIPWDSRVVTGSHFGEMVGQSDIGPAG
jgi:hypothetical protein